MFFLNSLLLFDFSVCSYFNPPKNNSSQQRKMKFRQSYIFIPSPWRYGASVCLCAYFFWSYLFLNQMYPNQCITDFITKTSLISCFFFQPYFLVVCTLCRYFQGKGHCSAVWPFILFPYSVTMLYHVVRAAYILAQVGASMSGRWKNK